MKTKQTQKRIIMKKKNTVGRSTEDIERESDIHIADKYMFCANVVRFVLRIEIVKFVTSFSLQFL